MLTRYDAQKLTREYRRELLMQEGKHEPATVIPVILQSVAGLLTIGGVALFGAMAHVDRNASSDKAYSDSVVLTKVMEPPVNGKSSSQRSGPSIIQHSRTPLYRPQFQVVLETKQVFDERRRRYIEAYPDSHVARQMGTLELNAKSDGG